MNKDQSDTLLNRILSGNWLRKYKTWTIDLEQKDGGRYRTIKQSWNRRIWHARLPTMQGDNYIEYRLCLLCFDIRRRTVDEHCKTFGAGLCSSCRACPADAYQYYDTLYKSLLSAEPLGKDFEHQFREEMLLHGFYCSYTSTGGIRIGSEVPPGIRSCSTTASLHASNEGDTLPDEMEIYSSASLQSCCSSRNDNTHTVARRLRYSSSDENKSEEL